MPDDKSKPLQTMEHQKTEPPEQSQKPVPLTRTEILELARQNVTQSRHLTHGEAEDSFAEIAEHWSTHLGIKVTNYDVAAMMVMFKLVRFKRNPPNPENSSDGAGYFGIAGELAMKRACG